MTSEPHRSEVFLRRMTYQISEIEKIHSDWYKPDFDLSRDDQKFIWENTPLPQKDEQRLTRQGVNINAYENVNGGCKYGINNELNWPKYELVFQLSRCTSKDPEKEIAKLLQEIFKPWPSIEGHWLWIAQQYCPRVINWQVSATIKEYKRGAIRKTPSAYFTYELSFRKKRKLKHQKEKEITT